VWHEVIVDKIINSSSDNTSSESVAVYFRQETSFVLNASSVVSGYCSQQSNSNSSVQVNPETGKHVLHISTPLWRPMCLFSDAHLTRGKQQCTTHY